MKEGTKISMSDLKNISFQVIEPALFILFFSLFPERHLIFTLDQVLLSSCSFISRHSSHVGEQKDFGNELDVSAFI